MVMDVWTKISLFESTDLVKRFFERRHKRKLNTSKANEIVSSLVQGREYMKASKVSGNFVRPLFLYYGVLSLSRGLILLLDPSLRECGLAKSHGLSAEGWGEVLSKGIQHLGELEIKLGAGTFRQLLVVTGNQEQSCIDQAPRPNKLFLRRRIGFTIPDGMTIKVKDLFSRISCLHELYEHTFDEKSACYRGFVFNLSPDTQTDISILSGRFGLPSESEVRKLFSIPKTITLRRSSRPRTMPHLLQWSYRIQHKNIEELVQFLPNLENTDPDQLFFIVPFNGGLCLSLLAKLFIASYLIGMLVRYYPTSWVALQNRQKGDFMLPIIRELLNLIETKFPSLFLDELEAY